MAYTVKKHSFLNLKNISSTANINMNKQEQRLMICFLALPSYLVISQKIYSTTKIKILITVIYKNSPQVALAPEWPQQKPEEQGILPSF